MWSPYKIGLPARIRPINTSQGLGDRLRLVAFAERQAFHSFNEAAQKFIDAPVELREAWRKLAMDEAKHESWLLKRLVEIGEDVSASSVGLNLYHSLQKCQTAKDFAFYISDAEERGRVGAEKFAEALAITDPITAQIFKNIAFEEREHIALAARFFKHE